MCVSPVAQWDLLKSMASSSPEKWKSHQLVIHGMTALKLVNKTTSVSSLHSTNQTFVKSNINLSSRRDSQQTELYQEDLANYTPIAQVKISFIFV